MRYEEMRRQENVGEIANYYRNRSQMKQVTLDRRGKPTAATWFMRGETTAILSTAATPASSLRDKLQGMLNTIPAAGGGRTKAVEASGAPIYMGLKKIDPFATDGCDYGDPDCLVDDKTSCSNMGACYRIVCSLCNCDESSTTVVTDTDTVTAPVQASNVVRSPAGPRTQMIAGSRRRSRNPTTSSSATMTSTTNSGRNK